MIYKYFGYVWEGRVPDPKNIPIGGDGCTQESGLVASECRTSIVGVNGLHEVPIFRIGAHHVSEYCNFDNASQISV